MKKMEVTEKELVVSKANVDLLFEQISQIKTGLLHVLDAVEGARIGCAELKPNKEKILEGVN